MKSAVTAAVLALGACSGTPLDGSVDGSQMVVSSSAAQTENGEISFVLSSADNVCSDLTGGAGEAGSTNLAILLLNSTNGSGGTQPVGTGTYTVGAMSGLEASGQYEKFADDCTAPITATLTGGTVVVTSVDNESGALTGALSGTLDLMLNSDHLSGSFSADACGTFSGLRCPIIPQ